MLRSSSSRPARLLHLPRAAAAGGSLLLVVALGACGDMTPPASSSGAPTGSAAVGVEEGQSSPGVPTTGTDVSGVIGSWAAQYGSARNQVLTAVMALGSAGGAEGVKAAAQDALVAVEDADTVLPCPDAATDQAYRSDLDALRTELEQLQDSGDTAAASDLAARAGTAFQSTESALTAAYA